MIFCRFILKDQSADEWKYGIVKNHQVQAISPNPFSTYEIGEEEIPFNEVKLCPPVLPTKIVAVGVNYKEHAKEMGHIPPEDPLIFLKPASSVIGPEELIQLPKTSSRVDYEAELAVVIKKKTKNILPEAAKDVILGYTCFNDVTARDLQKKDGQWTRAKGFDTFSAIGPWIVTDLEPSELVVESYLNGELKQNGKTSNMIFDIPRLISFISSVMTLEPGDIVSTGTPPGIGPMQHGDMIDIRIEGIGILRNFVE
ncbi:MAG: fumarylacetoacetate hydrolase family protein [Elusimicrobia bacterium]|nr:fumarylacetoacetate hydrolase family protein [Elusimicrobiota bacterium]